MCARASIQVVHAFMHESSWNLKYNTLYFSFFGNWNVKKLMHFTPFWLEMAMAKLAKYLVKTFLGDKGAFKNYVILFWNP